MDVHIGTVSSFNVAAASPPVTAITRSSVNSSVGPMYVASNAAAPSSLPTSRLATRKENYLGERGGMALPVRGGSGNDLDLAGGQHPDGGVLPSAGAVVQPAQHAAGGQPGQFHERAHPDAQPDRVPGVVPAFLLGAQAVVVEEFQCPVGGLVVVGRVVGQARDGGVRELLPPDPVAAAHLDRVHAEFHGQFVQHPLDAEGGLRFAGAAVGVGHRLVGEHVGAVEVVGGDLVDAVEHEAAEQGDTGGEDAEVSAHVGGEFHVQGGDRAVPAGRQGEFLHLVPGVVGGLHRLAA